MCYKFPSVERVVGVNRICVISCTIIGNLQLGYGLRVVSAMNL